MSSKYTPNADKVLKLAAAAAKDMKQNYIGTEHLLAGPCKGRGRRGFACAAGKRTGGRNGSMI
jgi:hypothetical protein